MLINRMFNLYFQKEHGDAHGGPYGCAHLRRRDFLYGHSKDVPSLKNAAQQITEALGKYNLTRLFLATDAPKKGIQHFCLKLYEIHTSKLYLYHVYQYQQNYMFGIRWVFYRTTDVHQLIE